MKPIYSSEGVLFDLIYRGYPISLPIDQENKGYLASRKSEEWEQFAAIDSLWIEGVVSQVSDNKCLIKYDDIYSIDEEILSLLGIPTRKIDISVYEKNNIGNRDYAIKWEAKDNGIVVGGIQRLGCILKGFDKSFLLSKDQYTLLEEIDSISQKDSFADRAKDIAKVKGLAELAEAQIDSFTDSRDFHYIDNVEINCEAVSNEEIDFSALINDFPEEYQERLGKRINHSEVFSDGNRKQYVFFDEEAREKYNCYNGLDSIKGTDVPRFLENPLSFFDEAIEFDQDKFAERVKGIKIHRSTPQPFVAVKRDENEPGWFDITMGIQLISETDELDEFQNECIENVKEYNELLKNALQNGDDYFLYHDQWIKVNNEQAEKYLKQYEDIDKQTQGHKVEEKRVHQILDIYDNVEGFEYSETDTIMRKREFKKYPVPNLFKGKLKDYQIDGYSFLRMQYEEHMGSLLADDMGLGKTVQVISFMLYLYEIGELCPALIVVPSVLIQNWVEEINKFGPGNIGIYRHIGGSRIRDIAFLESCDIVITTYETLARDQLVLGQISWKFMACDETQKIKNYQTLLASAVKGMNSKCRIAMTGTPVENRLGELWSIVDYVQPGLLKDYKWFKHTYEEPIQEKAEGYNDLINQLIDILHPIMLRRLKEDVLSGLPVKSDNKYQVRLSKLQSQMYKNILDNYQDDGNGNQILKTIQQMIMLCSHPRVIQGDIYVNSAKLLKESSKLEDTIRQLKEIRRKDEKVLIFTKYHKMQVILRKVILDEFGIDAKVINGEGGANRQEIVRWFNNSPGFNVMILSPRAAGVGLTITGANNVIHYTREWNPAIENQATDRVYRIGQERDVNVYYPISVYPDVFTVEEKLNDLLESKRELMRNVIVPVDLNIKAEDMKECLGL